MCFDVTDNVLQRNKQQNEAKHTLVHIVHWMSIKTTLILLNQCWSKRGQFSRKYLLKAPHGSPVRARYMASFESTNSNLCNTDPLQRSMKNHVILDLTVFINQTSLLEIYLDVWYMTYCALWSYDEMLYVAFHFNPEMRNIVSLVNMTLPVDSVPSAWTALYPIKYHIHTTLLWFLMLLFHQQFFVD